jgi:hypothetical protein
MLGGMRAGQSSMTLAVFDALASYLDDYKNPKGPLKITVNTPNKASAAALGDIKSPATRSRRWAWLSVTADRGAKTRATSRRNRCARLPDGEKLGTRSCGPEWLLSAWPLIPGVPTKVS